LEFDSDSVKGNHQVLTQVEPTVLLAVDGYRYGDRRVDRTEEGAQIRAGLSSVRHTVIVPYLEPDPGRVTEAVLWDVLIGGRDDAETAFE